MGGADCKISYETIYRKIYSAIKVGYLGNSKETFLNSPLIFSILLKKLFKRAIRKFFVRLAEVGMFGSVLRMRAVGLEFS